MIGLTQTHLTPSVHFCREVDGADADRQEMLKVYDDVALGDVDAVLYSIIHDAGDATEISADHGIDYKSWQSSDFREVRFPKSMHSDFSPAAEVREYLNTRVHYSTQDFRLTALFRSCVASCVVPIQEPQPPGTNCTFGFAGPCFHGETAADTGLFHRQQMSAADKSAVLS